jgi:hypothetical protein
VTDEHITEFDCVECGRHIIVICGPETDKCAACISLPGWFLIDEVARIIDPDYKSREGKVLTYGIN